MRAEYALPDHELRAHADDLFRRYDNPALGHTVPNVARDPMRKLAPGDRFHAAVTLAEKRGIRVPCAELGAAFALLYDAPGDVSSPKLQELLASKGIDGVLRERCGLNPASGPGGRIRALYEEARKAVFVADSVRSLIERVAGPARRRS
jgi:mannitol-1-phosphate 5-dehydrogenase